MILMSISGVLDLHVSIQENESGFISQYLKSESSLVLPPDGATADGSADPRDVSAMEVDDMTNNELDVLQSLSCSRLSVSTLR